MSKQVDERVVSMQFDNKQFERNVSQTMSTLDKLKQSLNLTGAAKGFEDVNSAANKVNMSALGQGVQAVQAKFSAMQVMAITALTNITNSAVNAGKRIASALTIDPIKTGFQEYETQINAVQTILANTESKGTTLQDVNSALDELNTYADKTIYNFTQMTRNIGTFTAAGVDLDKSVTSIKGIANLAAVSGSTSQQASTAMYQLSQALAAGKVSLMDWNSVVNAGMGGQVFQDALKRTATNMGKNVDGMIKKYGSFRESLTQGEWLTAEVLTETLTQLSGAYSEADLIAKGYTQEQAKDIVKMAETAENAATKVKTFTQLWDTLKESAQSGWTQSWEIMMGDFGEAKEFFTKVSDTIGGMIGASAERRNTLLEGGLSTGWKQLLGAGIADEAGYVDTLKNVAKEHGVSIDDMIKAEQKLDESLSDTDAFQKVLKQGLTDGTLSSDMLSESVSKLSEKMSNMSAEERKKAGYTAEHIKQIQELDKGLKDGSISMDDFTKKIMRSSGRENLIQSLWNAFEGLMSVINPVKEAFREIFPPMTGEQLYEMTVKIKEFTEKLKLSDENAAKIKTTFKGVFAVIDIVIDVIKALVGGAGDLISNFAGIEGGILGVTAAIGDWLLGLRDSAKESNIFATIVDKITTFVSNAITKIKEFGTAIKEGFKPSGLEGFLGLMKAIWNVIKEFGSSVAKAFGNLDIGQGMDLVNTGLFGGLLIALQNFINGGNPLKMLGDFFDDIGEKAGGFMDGIKETLDGVRECLQSYQQNLQAGTLQKIATAIGILAAAIFVISTIEPNSLEKSLGAIAVLFGELLGSLALFTKIDMGGMKKVTSSIPLMIGMSVAMLILAAAMKKMADISPEGILKGLVAIGVLMAEISLFLRAYKFDGKLKGTAIGIVILSSAMLILAKAVENFGGMDWGQIGKGLTAIGALLLELGLFTKLTSGSTNMISIGVGLAAIAGSMKIFASVMSEFAGMKVDELKRSLGAMAVVLAELVIALNLLPKNTIASGVGLIAVGGALKILTSVMSDLGGMDAGQVKQALIAMGLALAELAIALNLMNGTAGGSASLIIAAGALAIIAPVMKSLGEMSWGEIAKGLITLAGAFAVIGVAGLLLQPLLPAILGLAGAFALLGIGTLALGAGLTLVGVGISAIAGAVATGATAIVAGLTVIVVGIADLIPTVAKKLAEGVVAFAVLIGECAPELTVALAKLLVGVIDALATYVPQIVEGLFNLLIGIIDALAVKVPELIVSAVKLISAFFKGVVDALSTMDVESLFKGIIGIGLLSGLMMLLSAVAGLIPGAMVGVVGMGLVIAELAIVLAAIGALAQIPGLKWLIEEGGEFLQTIGNAIGKFVGGVVGGIGEGISASLPQIATDLSTFMKNLQPFIDGAKQIDATMMEGVSTLGKTILILTAANILDGIGRFINGGNSISTFGTELASLGTSLNQFTENLGPFDETKAASVKAAANAIKAFSEAASEIDGQAEWAKKIFGDNSIAAFGEDLPGLGTNLGAFATNLGTFDEATVATVTCAADAIKAMAEAAKGIDGQAEWAKKIFGDNGLASFGEEMADLGTNLKDFAKNIGTFSEDKVATVKSAVSAVKAFASLADANIEGAKANLPAFGAVLPDFAKDVTAFVERMPGSEGVDVAIANMKKIISMIKETASVNAANASEFASSLGDLGKAGVKEFVTAFTSDSAKTNVKAAAADLVKQSVDGAKSKETDVKGAFIKLVSTAVSSIGTEDQYSNFKNKGEYLAKGFAKGINSENSLLKVRTAAKAMAKAAEEAANKQLEINSPSKVFRRIGEGTGEGFVMGMERQQSVVYSASGEMASAAKSGMLSAISKISELIDSDMETQPTIRPVVDLSDVRAGAGAIDGMLSMSPSVGVLATAGGISSMMNNRIQNGSDNGVISAIKDLKTAINSKSGGNTYNVNGVTYDDGSNISSAVQAIVRAAVTERRI